MRAMLEAFRTQPLVARIVFNDPALIAEGLCSGQLATDQVRATRPDTPQCYGGNVAC
jgi:hypothetical protein